MGGVFAADIVVREGENSGGGEGEERSVVRIAYLGPQASYTHQATVAVASQYQHRHQQYSHLPSQSSTPQNGDSLENNAIRLVAERTISDVFEAVVSGAADVGVVPFENSTNGCVPGTLDLFASFLIPSSSSTIGTAHVPVASNDHSNDESSASTSLPPSLDSSGQTNSSWQKKKVQESNRRRRIEVTQETFVPVKHCLLGHHHQVNAAASSSPSDPADPLSAIKTIYTHPQAWSQCSNFLASHPALKSADKIDVSSTSRAAELAAADPSGASVAIASSMASQLHNVPVLREGIQDRQDNVTRFLVLQRPLSSASIASQGAPPVSDVVEAQSQMSTEDVRGGGEDNTKKALVAFTVKSHFTQPGALASSLGVFAKHALNLTSINARPSGTEAWHYIMFVEFSYPASFDSTLEAALTELEDQVESCILLGSWPAVHASS